MANPIRNPPLRFRSSESDPDSTKFSNIFYSSQVGANWVKGYETDKPLKRLRDFVTEPANCNKKKVQRKGLRVHVESSHPARHKTKLAAPTLQTSLPSLFCEARAPCTSYLIGQQRSQSMPQSTTKSRTTRDEKSMSSQRNCKHRKTT